jgi:hypothetical protein
MLRTQPGGRGGREAGDPAGSARRRPRSRLPHVSLRLGPPSLHLGSPSPHAPGRGKIPAPPQRPLTTEKLPVPARGSRLPAPLPPAPAPARAPAPACAAAAAGREGEGGRERRPRLPLAQVRAEVSVAASARGLGLWDAPSLSLARRRWR